jgi:hypothetical protein
MRLIDESRAAALLAGSSRLSDRSPARFSSSQPTIHRADGRTAGPLTGRVLGGTATPRASCALPECSPAEIPRSCISEAEMIPPPTRPPRGLQIRPKTAKAWQLPARSAAKVGECWRLTRLNGASGSLPDRGDNAHVRQRRPGSPYWQIRFTLAGREVRRSISQPTAEKPSSSRKNFAVVTGGGQVRREALRPGRRLERPKAEDAGRILGTHRARDPRLSRPPRAAAEITCDNVLKIRILRRLWVPRREPRAARLRSSMNR